MAAPDPGERARGFVAESEALAGRAASVRPGHLRALQAAAQGAAAGRAPAPDDVRAWHAHLADGADVAAPDWARLEAALAPVRSRLEALAAEAPAGPNDLMSRMMRRPSQPSEIASWMGEAYRAAEEAGAPGEVARLLAAYVALFCAAPLPVFRTGEQTALDEASLGGLDRLKAHMADKLMEAVYHPSGAVLERASSGGETVRYGDDAGRLLVDWSELVARQAAWRGGAPG